jgi:hypothetical protein
MAPIQKPKATDVVYHPPAPGLARDGRTPLADPGVQVTRALKQSGQPTLMADIKFPLDATEPQWSDRSAESVDIVVPSVVPGATNGPR